MMLGTVLLSVDLWSAQAVSLRETDLSAALVEQGDTFPEVRKAGTPSDLNGFLPQTTPAATDELLTPDQKSDSPDMATDLATPLGTPQGQGADQLSPILPTGTNAEPPVPPMMNTSKAFQLSLDVQAIYDNNIFFRSKDPVADYIFIGSPKLSLQRGDFRAKEESYGILNYNPQAIYFAQGHGKNTLDQNLKIETQYAIARLAVGLDASYQHLSGATADLGNRIDRDLLGAKLRLTYGWGPKLDAETNFLYTSTSYNAGQLADYSEFVNETFLRYAVTARTRVALGAGVGRLTVDGFGHQDFERALVQVISDVGAKVTLRAKGGLEFRQTQLASHTTPIFSLAMDYKMREGTTFSLEAFREVTASGGSPGDNLTRTGVAAKVRQKVGEKFAAGLDVGYEKLSYTAAESKRASATTVRTSNRTDDYYFLRPSVQYELKEGRRLEVYYLHRANESNLKDTSFEADQLGISAGIDF